MQVDLTMRQRIVTYAAMGLASILFYLFVLVKQCALVQTLYLGLISIIYTGDRPMHIYAVCATLKRDLK